MHRATSRALRSGGHRRGDLWTSGKRTTVHHPELYDQMVVAQTAEEKRIRSESTTPADLAKTKAAGRAIREHYNASVEHLGVQAQTVNTSGGTNLTSRPSYTGANILAAYSGETSTMAELDVAGGIRKDQFVYYDDEGRRLQHPTTAQMMANAGLATSEELSERLALEYQKALQLGGQQQQQGALGEGGPRSLEGGGSTASNGRQGITDGSGSADPLVGGAHAAGGGGMVSLGRDDGTSTYLQRGAPSALAAPREEVAALTRVRDKRDLLYNQKLRTHWDSAQEDPLRGTGFRGPKRNIDNGGVVVKGTERPTSGEGYFEAATTVAEAGVTSMGRGLRASSRAEGTADGLNDHLATNGNVFRMGEENFNRSMHGAGRRNDEVRDERGDGDGAAGGADDQQQPFDGIVRTARVRPDGTPATMPGRRGGGELSTASGDAPLSSASQDPKYASQRVDINNPRVGPEFFHGADVAMDADLRKALDERMRAVREGKAPPSLSSILAAAERRDGINTHGALDEAAIDADVERILDAREAAARSAQRPAMEGEKGAGQQDAPSSSGTAGDDAAKPARRRQNLAAPKGTREKDRAAAAAAASGDGSQSLASKASSYFSSFFSSTDAQGRPTLAGGMFVENDDIKSNPTAKEDIEAFERRRRQQEEADQNIDAKHNARLGIRNTRATSSNSPVGRRQPITYDSAKDMGAERLMMNIMGAGVEFNITSTDSREMFTGGWDIWGKRRQGSNSYTEAANASGRFSNRLSANYFANDQLHAGMQASSRHHGAASAVDKSGGGGNLGPSAGLSAGGVRNKAFTQFQKQAKEDPYGAARNVGVGAGGLSAISNSQSSGGSGVGSSYSQSSEGERAVNAFTFRQILKQLDHSRMQPTNHDDMFGDCLKYLEAYIDLSGMVGSAEGAGSNINVVGSESDDGASDTLLPRAALKGRMVGLLFYTDSARSRLFFERLAQFQEQYRGDLVILGISYAAYERRDLLRRHRFCSVPPNMGSRYVARDAGFNGSWWQPFPSLFILDGSSGRVVSRNGYAAVSRNPTTCYRDWVRGEEGANVLDILLSRYDVMSAPMDTERMTQRVMDDFGLKERR